MLSLLLVGCGVAGAPIAPGPVPPAAPGPPTVVRLVDGFEVVAAAPEVDVDGRSLETPATLLLFVDQPTCEGRPAAVAKPGRPLRLQTTDTAPVSLRVVAARGTRQGAPSQPVRATWSAPPAAPEKPIAFVDGAGKVQLTWLPPEVATVRILRNGEPVGTAPAEASLYTDAPGKGRHRYAVEGVGADFRTAPSESVEVVVP